MRFDSVPCMISRKPSVATAQADDVRNEMLELFENVDEDGNGTVDLQELRTIVKNKLQMQLTDPIHDVEIIFAMVDKDNTGYIDSREFIELVEPVVLDYERRGLHMESHEIVREAFISVIENAKDERTIVNKAFLWAHEYMNENGMGFGTSFWGHSWRFRLYDDFYDFATDENEKPVPPPLRLQHLKRKLEGVLDGTELWLENTRHERVKKEIFNKAGLVEYCRLWLVRIRLLEAEAEEQESSSPGPNSQPQLIDLTSTISKQHGRRRSLALEMTRAIHHTESSSSHASSMLSAANTLDGTGASSRTCSSDLGDT